MKLLQLPSQSQLVQYKATLYSVMQPLLPNPKQMGLNTA